MPAVAKYDNLHAGHRAFIYIAKLNMLKIYLLIMRAITFE